MKTKKAMGREFYHCNRHGGWVLKRGKEMPKVCGVCHSPYYGSPRKNRMKEKEAMA